MGSERLNGEWPPYATPFFLLCRLPLAIFPLCKGCQHRVVLFCRISFSFSSTDLGAQLVVPPCRLFLCFEMGKRRTFQNLKIPRPLQDSNKQILLWMGGFESPHYSIYHRWGAPQKYKECLELTLRCLHDFDYIPKAASEDEHICFLNHNNQPHFMLMYEALFSKFRICLQFTNFQTMVLLFVHVTLN